MMIACLHLQAVFQAPFCSTTVLCNPDSRGNLLWYHRGSLPWSRHHVIAYPATLYMKLYMTSYMMGFISRNCAGNIMATPRKLLIHAIAAVQLALLAATPTPLATATRLARGDHEAQLQMRAAVEPSDEYTYVIATQLFDPALNVWVAVEDVDDTATGAAIGRYTPVMQHSGPHRALLDRNGCHRAGCVSDLWSVCTACPHIFMHSRAGLGIPAERAGCKCIRDAELRS